MREDLDWEIGDWRDGGGRLSELFDDLVVLEHAISERRHH